YLIKSKQDVLTLAQDGVNIRLVKGAYKESPEVAYVDKLDVDKNFMRLIRLQLTSGAYAAVATHDDQIIQQTKQWVQKQGYTHDRFEFQMLYGMRTKTQRTLVDQGYTVRVYVPYGHDWYGYFMRRLAERP